MEETNKKKTSSEKVFLVPKADDTWKTVIADTLPVPAAAALSAEGEYPVEVYYRRTDLNGSGTIEMDHCQNRDELARSLDWIGQCGYLLLSFWDYDYAMPMESTLTEILDKAYERGHQQRMQVLAEIESESECRSLTDLIQEAQSKADASPSSEPPDRTPDL